MCITPAANRTESGSSGPRPRARGARTPCTGARQEGSKVPKRTGNWSSGYVCLVRSEGVTDHLAVESALNSSS
jgi:hypothetical protein